LNTQYRASSRGAILFRPTTTNRRRTILYTIVESCRRQGIDPVAYLRYVLTRLPKMLITEVASITPQAWAKAQRQPPELKVAS